MQENMNDKEKQYKQIQDWRKRNPNKVREYRKKYYKKNPYSSLTTEQKAKRSQKEKERRQKYKEIAVEKYGGCCNCCGEDIQGFLCFDHIKGGGNQHRKEMTERSIGVWLYKNNYPKDFQLLCYNCNAVKETYDICPCKSRS